MGVFFMPSLIENGLITSVTLFGLIGEKCDLIRTVDKWVDAYCRKGYGRFCCEIIS
jgi:hypothetical protein